MNFLTKDNARVGMYLALNPDIAEQTAPEDRLECSKHLIIAEIPDDSEYKADEIKPGVMKHSTGRVCVWCKTLYNGTEEARLLVFKDHPTFIILKPVTKEQKSTLETLLNNLKQVGS
jgi:hypothetical protein